MGSPEEQAAVVKTLQDAGIPAVLPPAPADRIRRVLWEGQEYAIDPTAMDDVEVLEILAEMDDKPFLLVKFVKHLIGDEQWERLKEEHKDAAGRLTVTRLGDFMTLVNKELEALGN